MEVLMIKAVLQRSNPTLLRQFTVPGEYILKDLGEMLGILLGWDQPGIFSASDGTKTILPETRLKDAAEGRSSLFLTFVDNNSSARRWTFRLLFMGTVQQEEDYPRLIRTRGHNLPQGVGSMKDFNRLQNYWTGGEIGYYSMLYRSFPESNYVFSQGKANLRLKQKFSLSGTKKGSPRIELDYSDTTNMRNYLEGITVQELRQIADTCQIKLPKGLKKEGIVSYLSEKMAEPEPLGILLDKMTLNQYRAFKKLLTTKDAEKIRGAAEEAVILLEMNRYAMFYGRSYWGDPELRCTHQLFEAYEQWLDKTDEKEFLRLALLRSTIAGCVNLHGCLRKDDWKEWGPKIAGKSYTERELNAAWDAVRQSAHHRNISCLEENTAVLCLKGMPEESALSLMGKYRPQDFYLPTLPEIRQIENGGLIYSGRLEEELRTILSVNYDMKAQEVRKCEEGIYHSFQLGEDADDYAEWLNKQLRGGKGRALERLKKTFRVLRQNTRQILYGGYTQNEMERMRK